jgi:hypothetical protein
MLDANAVEREVGGHRGRGGQRRWLVGEVSGSWAGAGLGKVGGRHGRSGQR